MKNNIVNAATRVVCVFAVSALLSACSLYGKYQPENTDADSITIPSYIEIFTDPILQQHIADALINNYDMQIAHEHVAQADASLVGAKLAFLPSIGVGAQPAVQYSHPGNNVTYTFASASWEIDIFGRLTNQKRMAAAARKQAIDYEQAARTELIAAVAETYYLLLMLDEQIAICDSTEANWKNLVTTMRALKSAGQSDEAAIAQFEGAYYAVRVSSKNLRLQRVQAENAMRLLLCVNGGEIRRTTLAAQHPLENRVSSINLRATVARPDVRAAEHEVERAFYNVNLSRANCCPSISIGGAAGWNGGLILSAVGNFFQPLFNSGRNIAEVRRAKSYQTEAVAAYSKALLKAGLEVNDALAAQASYVERRVDLTNQVKAMSRALEATTLKMQLGYGTYLEVLTAQNDFLSAQLEYTANTMYMLQSQVELYHAIGGGK